MVCPDEVYHWFKDWPPHQRVDFLCNILHLCLPAELRFIGTVLEDINSREYAGLREAEDKSNSGNEFMTLPSCQLAADSVHKLCLGLSLLKATNQQVAQIIYEILCIHYDYARSRVCLVHDDDLSAELLLVYALASHHPAFTFDKKERIGCWYRDMLVGQNELSVDSNNSSADETQSEMLNDGDREYLPIFRVAKVVVNGSDALVSFTLSSNSGNDVRIMEGIVSHSDLVNCLLRLRSDLKESLRKLSSNGNFTSTNISSMLEQYVNECITNGDMRTFLNAIITNSQHRKSPAPSMYTNDKIVNHSHRKLNIIQPLPSFCIDGPKRTSNGNLWNTSSEHRKSAIVSVNNPLMKEKPQVAVTVNESDMHCRSASLDNSEIYRKQTDNQTMIAVVANVSEQPTELLSTINERSLSTSSSSDNNENNNPVVENTSVVESSGCLDQNLKPFQQQVFPPFYNLCMTYHPVLYSSMKSAPSSAAFALSSSSSHHSVDSLNNTNSNPTIGPPTTNNIPIILTESIPQHFLHPYSFMYSPSPIFVSTVNNVMHPSSASSAVSASVARHQHQTAPPRLQSSYQKDITNLNKL